MSKILKNTTAGIITVTDMGINISASPGQYLIQPQEYLMWAASNDVVTLVGNGDLVVNDGSYDLSISDGIDLIKGIFPKDLGVLSGDDQTPIGHVGDRLKVDATVTVSNVVSQEYLIYLLDNDYVYCSAHLVNAASSALHNPVILFRNPSGSGKNIYFLQASGNSTISNERTLFRVFEGPTVTGPGSAITTRNRRLGGGAGAAVALVNEFPTISATGYNISNIQTGENTNSQDFVDMQQLCLLPGQTILITAQPKSNNRVQAITLVWAEVPE